MNISGSEELYQILAKTCGCITGKRKVTYSLANSYHALCMDKKDILLSEIEACERLLKYTKDEFDYLLVEKEIGELRLALDMLR